MQCFMSSLKIELEKLAIGEVHHIRHKHVILLDDEGNEYILPKENQIPSDFFRKGDNVRAI